MRFVIYWPFIKYAVAAVVREVWHRFLHFMMAKVISTNQRDWSEYLGYVIYCYNATVHSATGFFTFFLITGRETVWSVDFLFPKDTEGDTSPPEFVRNVRERLRQAFILVRENLQRSAEVGSCWYNCKVARHEFSVGDAVRVFWPRRFRGRTPKWQNLYQQTGRVAARLNDATYVIQLDRREKKVFYSDKIKLINSPTTAHFYTHPIPLGSTLTPDCFLNILTPFCTDVITVRATAAVTVAATFAATAAATVAATVAAVFLL